MIRLAWLAAFRVPADDHHGTNLLDEYDDSLIEVVYSTFPFFSDYSCAWFIDRVYRYMGRTVLSVKQESCDDTLLMNLAPTVPPDVLSRVCNRVVMGDDIKTEQLVQWLRSLIVSNTVPVPFKANVRVQFHFDEQPQCAYEEAAQKTCNELGQMLGSTYILVRYTPMIIDGSPVYCVQVTARR
tara:strand:- start:1004 stop:1552 length:549 start_codon:yes stop_codon:yes gene_type:complete